MRRREFIAGTAASMAFGFAGSTHAQTSAAPAGTKRMAVALPAGDPKSTNFRNTRDFKSYWAELNKRGYFEGKNLIVERYSGGGRVERYREMASAIVASHPDLILSVAGTLSRHFKALTSTIPIVALSADPVESRLVTNLARPGANITGISSDAGIGMWSKRLQLLSDTTRLTTVRFLATTPQVGEERIGAVLREAAQPTGISLNVISVGGGLEQAAYERAFDAMEQDKVDGLIVSDASEHGGSNQEVIVHLAAKHRLPTIYPAREFVEVGGLLAYEVDSAEVWRQLADLVADVLGGANPGDIPYRQQTKFELVLNRTTARSLGLQFPATLLAVADEVIE
jgi:putative ABC transport system substrate-binding protein